MSIACATPWLFLLLGLPQDSQGPGAQGTMSRPASTPMSRRSPSSIAGVFLWKGIPPGRADDACIVGPLGELANAVVVLIPLEGQDLGHVPPPQVPVAGKSPSAVGAPRDDEPRVQVRRNEDPAKGAGSISWGVEVSGNPAEGNVSYGKPLIGHGRSFDDVRVYRFTTVSVPQRVMYVLNVSLGEHRITGKDGAFRFDGLPTRKYEVAVWHESGRRFVREVTLDAEKPLKLDIELR